MTDQVSVDPAGPEEQRALRSWVPLWWTQQFGVVAQFGDGYHVAWIGPLISELPADAVELRPVSPSPATTEAESRGARRSGHPCPTFGGGCYDPEHCMQGGRCEDAKRFFAVPAVVPVPAEDVRTEWAAWWGCDDPNDAPVRYEPSDDQTGLAVCNGEATARWFARHERPDARVARRSVPAPGSWVAVDPAKSDA